MKKTVNDIEMELSKSKQLQTKTSKKLEDGQEINDLHIEDIRALKTDF
jgi:hypothetical protein